MEKLFGKLMPHTLTIQPKLDRKQIRIFETWIYHHDPKLKQEHLQWTEAGCSVPKQVKSQRSAKKVMASEFF